MRAVLIAVDSKDARSAVRANPETDWERATIVTLYPKTPTAQDIVRGANWVYITWFAQLDAVICPDTYRTLALWTRGRVITPLWKGDK